MVGGGGVQDSKGEKGRGVLVKGREGRDEREGEEGSGRGAERITEGEEKGRGKSMRGKRQKGKNGRE